MSSRFAEELLRQEQHSANEAAGEMDLLLSLEEQLEEDEASISLEQSFEIAIQDEMNEFENAREDEGWELAPSTAPTASIDAARYEICCLTRLTCGSANRRTHF